jgi:hypothetical protein
MTQVTVLLPESFRQVGCTQPHMQDQSKQFIAQGLLVSSPFRPQTRHVPHHDGIKGRLYPYITKQQQLASSKLSTPSVDRRCVG